MLCAKDAQHCLRVSTIAAILDILERQGARASFYVIGERAELQLETLVRMTSLRCEVGSHAYYAAHHVDLRTLTPALLLQTLSLTHDVITRITGQAPVTFRPPFGFYNAQVLTTAGRLGYTTVLWDVDSQDWQSLSAQQILQNVLPPVQNGSIILMHSGTTLPGEDLSGTVTALPDIIRDLRLRGFELVTAEELLGLR